LINECIDCGHCKKHCPYELDTPQLLKNMLKAYEKFYLEKTKISSRADCKGLMQTQ
jgi:predicted aldo/keto reductase-like oxidoreductase